jgi:cell division protein FtsN
MAKDMKEKAQRKGGGGIPGPIWLLGGFALGVIVTVLYRVGTPLPGRAPTTPAATASTAGAAATPATNEFTFHDILGNLEVAVPGKIKPEAKPAGTADGGKPGDVAKPAPAYALQVGAFRTEAEADRMRAELALLGFEPKIQKATIDDKDTWYRVRLGPFKDAAEFEKVRARLDENKVKSVPVRSGP